MKEVWTIKENGGKGVFVGIASNKSRWFIAEEVLIKNAELICQLFNASQQVNSADAKRSCGFCAGAYINPDMNFCPKCGRDLRR